MTELLLIAEMAGLFYVTWVCFVLYCARKILKERGELTWKQDIMLGPALIVGGLADVMLNWTVGLLLGITPHLTLTGKLSSIRARRKGGYRQWVADFICHSWLNPFDPGHC